MSVEQESFTGFSRDIWAELPEKFKAYHSTGESASIWLYNSEEVELAASYFGLSDDKPLTLEHAIVRNGKKMHEHKEVLTLDDYSPPLSPTGLLDMMVQGAHGLGDGADIVAGVMLKLNDQDSLAIQYQQETVPGTKEVLNDFQVVLCQSGTPFEWNKPSLRLVG